RSRRSHARVSARSDASRARRPHQVSRGHRRWPRGGARGAGRTVRGEELRQDDRPRVRFRFRTIASHSRAASPDLRPRFAASARNRGRRSMARKLRLPTSDPVLLMDTLLKDLTYAARGLRKNLGFATVATVTIALGIGACTAIFSVVNAVLLRPLPYADAQRLVIVWGEMRARNVKDWPFSPPDLRDLQVQSTDGFEDVAGMIPPGRVPLWQAGRAPLQT